MTTDKLTSEQLALLGTESDAAFGRRVGLPANAVWFIRRALGVDKFDPFKELRAPEVEATIGMMPDPEVIAKFGLKCAVSTVATYRRNHLKRVPYGCSEKMVPTPEQIALLGTDTDMVIAEKIGVSRDVVAVWRHQREIPKYKRGGPRAADWEHEEDVLLGTDTDANIALVLGRTLLAVGMRRRKLGIPSARGPGTGRKPVTATVPTPVVPRNYKKKKNTPPQ